MEKTLPKKTLSFLKKIHNEFQPLLTKLSLEKENTTHIIMASLYGTIIELTGSVIFLHGKSIISSIPILLRSALEAHIDLINLIQDSKYINHLKTSFIKEQLKIFEAAKKGGNEYLSELSALPNLDERIVTLKRDRKSLENKGYKSLKIEDKFKKAKFENEYQSMYNDLWCDSHNNLKALCTRHIKSKNGVDTVEVYRSYSSDDSLKYIWTSVVILLRSTEFIHDFFKSSALKEVNAFRQEFGKIHAEGSFLYPG